MPRPPKGSLSADGIHVVWDGGASEGIYTGSIDAGGHVTGTTVDRFRPQNRAYWDMGYVSGAQY